MENGKTGSLLFPFGCVHRLVFTKNVQVPHLVFYFHEILSRSYLRADWVQKINKIKILSNQKIYSTGNRMLSTWTCGELDFEIFEIYKLLLTLTNISWSVETFK